MSSWILKKSLTTANSALSHIGSIILDSWPYMLLLLVGKYYADMGLDATVFLAILGGAIFRQYSISSLFVFDLKEWFMSNWENLLGFVGIGNIEQKTTIDPATFVFTPKNGYYGTIEQSQPIKPVTDALVVYRRTGRDSKSLASIMYTVSLDTIYNIVTCAGAIFLLSMVDAININNIIESVVSLFASSSSSQDSPQRLKLMCDLSSVIGSPSPTVEAKQTTPDILCRLVDKTADAIGQTVFYGNIVKPYVYSVPGDKYKSLYMLQAIAKWVDEMILGTYYSLPSLVSILQMVTRQVWQFVGMEMRDVPELPQTATGGILILCSLFALVRLLTRLVAPA
jgi:hypothetical protein